MSFPPDPHPAGLSRRHLIRTLGLGGAALLGGPALLAACATSVDDGASDGGASAGDPDATLAIHHDAGVGPLLQPYVDDFNARYKPLSLTTAYVTTDYPGTTNTQLAGGAVDYDVLFTDGNAQLWYTNKWISALDDFTGAKELTQSWLPGVLQECQGRDGELIALPYYRGIEIFLYNADLLGRINAAPPTSWDEMVEQCRELKAKRIAATPYSPFWTAEFSMFFYELVAESFSDGAGPFFADDFQPLFQDDPVVAATLARWATMYAEGLVPRDIFTTSYGDIVNIYAGGKSAFTVRYGPQAKGFRDPKQSQVAEASRNALMPGRTRETAAAGAFWCMTASRPNKPQAWNLLEYLAAKDKDGKYHTPLNLITLDLGLLTPYEAVNSDPAVRQSWSQWADVDLISQQLTKSRSLGRVRQQAWFGEFLVQATAALQDVVRAKRSARDGLAAAADFVKSKL